MTARQEMTVGELIAELQRHPADLPVSAWSGCHDCGGRFIEVEVYREELSITGYEFPPEDAEVDAVL